MVSLMPLRNGNIKTNDTHLPSLPNLKMLVLDDLIQICSQTNNFLLARGEAGEASLTPTRLLERVANPYESGC